MGDWPQRAFGRDHPGSAKERDGQSAEYGVTVG